MPAPMSLSLKAEKKSLGWGLGFIVLVSSVCQKAGAKNLSTLLCETSRILAPNPALPPVGGRVWDGGLAWYPAIAGSRKKYN